MAFVHLMAFVRLVRHRRCGCVVGCVSVKEQGGTHMAVLKTQGVYWIGSYGNDQRKPERIGADKRPVETVLKKRKVEIAEGRFLEQRKAVTTTFDKLADTYLAYAVHQQHKRS
jgi:hypothetical protein